jgi:hypothetical protein
MSEHAKTPKYSIETAYPELFEGAKTAESLEDHIVTHELNGHTFRIVVRKDVFRRTSRGL